MQRRTFGVAALAALTIFLCPASAAPTVSVIVDGDPGMAARYGIEAVEKALEGRGFAVERAAGTAGAKGDFLVVAGLAKESGIAASTLQAAQVPIPAGAESLAVRKTEIAGKPAIVLCGGDSRGLMYAALDAADRIGWNSETAQPFASVADANEKPDITERAVSAYTMQRGYFESRLYDENYWPRYFDMLARSRIDSFVLIFGYENGGFMAPAYPYFFNVEKFPGVELVGITAQQQERNRRAFQRMIDAAHERGVDFGVAIWDHIYRGGVQGGGIAGASELAGKRVPGLVTGLNAENLDAYTKAALSKFLKVFPDIDTLQFRMHGESGLKRDEMPVFWHEMFGLIKSQRPSLRVDIRAKELPDSIIQDAIDQGLNIRVATKFWMEQMGLPFHPTHVNHANQDDRRHGYADLLRYPKFYKVHWRLWNGGTTRLLLWGNPEYVRRFAESAHVYGGDTYEVNEMLATKMLGEPHEEKPLDILTPSHRYYDYEFERYWHFYQVWGRVGYDPKTPASTWEHEFQRRFGKAAGEHLMKGLHEASWVLPRIVASSYHYGKRFPTTRGWAEMNRMEDLPEYAKEEGSDIQQFMNVHDEAVSRIDGTDTAMRRPEESALWFDTTAAVILEQVREAEKAASGRESKEFVSTVTDLKILAHLAEYHARRLRAGVDYNLYKATGDLFAFDDAIAGERRAIEAWEKIVAAAGGVYSANLAFGVERVGFARHWKDELQALRRGLDALETARQKAKLTPKGGGVEIAHAPVRRIGLNEPLKVRATVAADAGVERVDVLYRQGQGEYHTLPMRNAQDGMYQAEIPGMAKDVRIDYLIEASGKGGGTATYPAEGKAKPIEVVATGDTEPPAAELTKPTRVKPGHSLRVTAKVTDPSGVEWVRLRYRHATQFEDYATAPMKLNAATGFYEGEIPGEFIIPKWDVMYFVETLDTKGNGRMYPDLKDEAPYVIVQLDRS